jgi:hypothetical protein
MLLGDPAPVWVEGRLVEPGDPLAPAARPLPAYDVAGHCFVPPAGKEIADPMVDFFRVGYAGGAEGIFVPTGRFDIDVIGAEGRAFAWDNGDEFRVRRSGRPGTAAAERVIRREGDSPTVCTIRDLIREIETGERTAGNIDVTLPSVEVQFGLAHSHLQGGARVTLPVADRSLYIPGG